MHWYQAVEDHPKYWEAISSALAIGWLDIVVCILFDWNLIGALECALLHENMSLSEILFLYRVGNVHMIQVSFAGEVVALAWILSI